MNIVVEGPTLLLDRRQTLALIDAAGTVASLKSGLLWITMENDARDIVLAAGESWTIERDGRTVVNAEDVSTLVLTEPVPTRSGFLGRFRLRERLRAFALRFDARPTRAAVPYY